MRLSGLRSLLDRLTRDMDAKADSSFGGLMLARMDDESARDEFMTAHVVARLPRQHTALRGSKG